jgi:type II secretory pathway pseudopilin PulG
MGIIAILAGVLLEIGSTVINAAKRARAQNMAVQIQTACLGYYTEYSVYPVPGNTAANTDYVLTDQPASAGGWGTLICILCGNIEPYSPSTVFATSGASMTNSRSIAFLTLRNSDVDANNAPLNTLPIPASNNIYFNIAINSSYSGVLGTNAPTLTVMPNFATSTSTTMVYTGGTSTAGVAVWENCNGLTTLHNPNFWVHTY